MFLLSLVLASAVLVSTAAGQGPGPDKTGARPEKSTPDKATAEKKLTGRLPAYFGEVVSKEQRAKIYEIQSRYVEQIVKLREQIEVLEKQQQTDVEAVLTPEQRDQVNKRTAEAKAKRAQRAAAASASDEPKTE
jgi:hypothetical protein